jgi:hypothetical protein
MSSSNEQENYCIYDHERPEQEQDSQADAVDVQGISSLMGRIPRHKGAPGTTRIHAHGLSVARIEAPRS